MPEIRGKWGYEKATTKVIRRGVAGCPRIGGRGVLARGYDGPSVRHTPCCAAISRCSIRRANSTVGGLAPSPSINPNPADLA